MLRQTAVIYGFIILLLVGCQVPYLSSPIPIDQLYIVSIDKYRRHFSGYFVRENIKPLPTGKPLQILYLPKQQNIGVLLQRDGLYRFFDTSEHPKGLAISPKNTYRQVLRMLEKKGYITHPNFRKLGYRIAIAPRRIQGVKTWFVDINDYHHLKQRYLKVLKKRDYRTLEKLPVIPQELIAPELLRIISKTSQPNRRKELIRLAKRLHINIPPDYNQSRRYEYYLFHATRQELKSLIDSHRRFSRFNEIQRRTLRQHYKQLYHEAMLRNGSLDELLEYYEHHKDPAIKARIMSLLKKAASKH